MPSRNQNINQTTQINHPIKRQHSSQLQKVHPNNESFQTNQSKNTHGNQNKSSKSNRNLYRTTKKRGTAAKVGRGIVSRMFYTIALVKKRLLEMELEGEIEASVGALGIVYCAEVEVHKAEDIHEQDLFLLEIEQNGNFGDEEEKDREKDKEKTGPGFIKKTVNKFLGGFKDQLVLLAEKMDTHHLEGKVGIGLYLKLPLMCKIKLEPLISTHVLHEWYLKELELENKRFLGTLTVRVIGAKGINKKSACALSLKVGDVKWKTSFKGGNSDTFLWDETLQPFPCSPRGDEITLKIFQKALLGEELYDELFLKVDKFGLIPSQNKTVSIPFESGSLTFDFYQQFTKSNVHGILKVDIIEGKDLPKKDITGKSDPYVVLAQGKVTETSVTKILNNPKLSTVKSTWKNQTLFPVKSTK
eukprot:TRINITY_DN477_c0_g1_i1.p1 TRINITY_DN477_c0_g1~~TRINITY_DN477_c0_g1_i1.p1  ORF type:complete len:415 (-),score=114.77 TRINITY_DN477_c0_g1_i1:17-1261(-)